MFIALLDGTATMNTPKSIGPVRSMAEFEAACNSLRQAHRGTTLLFRGQTRLHPRVRSGRTRPGVTVVPEVERGWSALAAQMLGIPSDKDHHAMAKAVLQHYGMPTHYVDLTSDPRVALWFATHRYASNHRMYAGEALRTFREVIYTNEVEGTGYVVVLAFHDRAELEDERLLVSLETMSEKFLRPRRQKGWLMYDRPPMHPGPNDYWVATIEVDRTAIKADLSQDFLFPSPKDDLAYAALLSVPFVQFPGEYLDDEESPEERAKMFAPPCFANRALDLEEYRDHGFVVGALDHKWSDLTLYEPKPIQLWKWWRFQLGDIREGASADIANAVKITLSPGAVRALRKSRSARFRWPEVGSNNILFTMSQIAHDKVIDYGPPFWGVWLVRDDDLVIEQSTVSDEEKTSVGQGHIYLLRDGNLRRRNAPSSCTCGDPQSHDTRVRAMLRLSHLVQRGELVLLPHPMRVPGWFIVFDARMFKNARSGELSAVVDY